jgi:hypothetical protein
MREPTGCTAITRDQQTFHSCAAPLAWADASASCMAAGMQLIAITDDALNQWLADQIGEEAWIGASDIAEEGTWVWEGQSSPFWSGDQYGSAQDGAYERWYPTEPNDGLDADSDCAVIDGNGYWHDRACGDAHPYICAPL